MSWARLEGNKSFAVGHFAFGYALAKLTAQATKTEINIPVVLTLSVIPDIDIVLHILFPFVEHRGPLHSIIIAVILFVPILALYRGRALPYFVALIQHSLLGDYIVGRAQLLWPLTPEYYGIEVNMVSPINITLEWLIFATAMVVMLKTRDIQTLLQPHNSNLILAIPTFTVLLPAFFAFPLQVPIALAPPHIAYLILFLASLFIDIRKIANQSAKRGGAFRDSFYSFK